MHYEEQTSPYLERGTKVIFLTLIVKEDFVMATSKGCGFLFVVQGKDKTIHTFSLNNSLNASKRPMWKPMLSTVGFQIHY